MSRFPYGEVLNFRRAPTGAGVSGKNKAVLRLMALLLAMDSASPTLLSRARQGQPLAIATLVHQKLDSDEIDVTAWKRQGLLYLDLMSFERLVKADMLPSIHNTLAEAQPEGIRGIKISSYIYGEDMPCWMERWGPVPETVAAESPVQKPKILLPTLANAEKLLKDAVLGRHRRRLATGAIASLALIATGLSLSLGSPRSPLPSFAQQQDEAGRVKTRRDSPAFQQNSGQ